MKLSTSEVDLLKSILPKVMTDYADASYNSYNDQIEKYFDDLYDECEKLLKRLEEEESSSREKYIERDATLKNQRYYIEFRDIEIIPAADVQEVKHAHWVNGICTNCGIEKPIVTAYRGFDDIVYQYQGELNYCPNCGAKMDLRGE